MELKYMKSLYCNGKDSCKWLNNVDLVINDLLKKLFAQAQNLHLHYYGFLNRDVKKLDSVNSAFEIHAYNLGVFTTDRDYLRAVAKAIALFDVGRVSQKDLVETLRQSCLIHSKDFMQKEGWICER